MRLRRLQRWLVFLLLGAIVNVAVAWGCAQLASAYAQMTLRSANDEERALWSDMRPDGFNREAGTVHHSHSFGLERSLITGDLNLKLTPLADQKAVIVTSPTAAIPFETVAVMKGGWPTAALYGLGWTATGEGKRREVAQGLWRWKMDTRPIGIPHRPLWPGFAINTVFYAAILWLLFATPGFIRKRRRIQRGLCPVCAYPVGASEVCTECGASVTPKHA